MKNTVFFDKVFNSIWSIIFVQVRYEQIRRSNRTMTTTTTMTSLCYSF